MLVLDSTGLMNHLRSFSRLFVVGVCDHRAADLIGQLRRRTVLYVAVHQPAAPALLSELFGADADGCGVDWLVLSPANFCGGCGADHSAFAAAALRLLGRHLAAGGQAVLSPNFESLYARRPRVECRPIRRAHCWRG